MRWQTPLAIVLAVAAAAAGMYAEQPTFKAGTELVSLFVTVTDAQRRLIPDLEQTDFEILDNERPQKIVFFQNEAQPITVVVMLDTSGSMTGTIDLLKQSAEQFLIRLFPGDKAKVGAFNDKIQVLPRDEAFTNNRDRLIRIVKENLDFGYPTRLWDAVDESMAALEGEEGRRVVLVFTDGDDSASRKGRDDVLDRAREKDMMIYAIGMQSDYFNGQSKVRTRPDRGLRKVAEETGGGYFELTKTDDLGPTFTRVAQELHSQYVLGFSPESLDGKVHKLDVRVKRSGLTARGRKSYVAAPSVPTGGQ
jgi:Ca-activated chloride channel family protein